MRIKQLIALPLLALALSGCGGGENETFYKVGFLGAPCDTSPEWNDANMQRMKELGFNTIQLNVAWGYRPGDNPLNMEDVVAVPDEFKLPVDTTMLNENTGSQHVFLHSPEKIAARADELRSRIALCKKYGMRTIFHFGASHRKIACDRWRLEKRAYVADDSRCDGVAGCRRPGRGYCPR